MKNSIFLAILLAGCGGSTDDTAAATGGASSTGGSQSTGGAATTGGDASTGGMSATGGTTTACECPWYEDNPTTYATLIGPCGDGFDLYDEPEIDDGILYTCVKPSDGGCEVWSSQPRVRLELFVCVKRNDAGTP